jgi:putative ABC transport system permease protein
MLKHNLLIILRNFRRSKSSFFINLIGLSTGLACTLLIYLWVNSELNVDKWNQNDSRLYQVMTNNKNSDGIQTTDNTPDKLAQVLADEMPEVQYSAFVAPSVWFGNFTLSDGAKNIKAMGQFAGKDFFNVFSYNLLQGNSNQVLSGDNSIVISKNLAKKIFGTSKDAIGKSVECQLLGFKMQAMVSGVFKGIPDKSTENFEFVLTWGAWIKFCNYVHRNIQWDSPGPYTYVLLKKGTNAKDFEKKIAGFIKTKVPGSNITLFIRRYSDSYLYNKYENGMQSGGRIEYVKLFSLIALFILLIACINFMNLSTAKASGRMKEIGIKKTIGASRKSLIIQYVCESALMAFISLFIALALIEFVLPQFNTLTGKHLSLSLNTNEILFIFGITLLTGLIAGSYPALYLSGFSPALVLKSKMKSSIGELWVRKGLVIFQFTLSVVLITAVVIVYKQMQFIQTKNLGYNKDNVIYFNIEGKVASHLDSFLSEIRNIPGVLNVSSTSQNIIGLSSSTYGLNWKGKTPGTSINFFVESVNYDFLKTLDIQLKEGRSFSRNYGADSSAIIFNEAAINIMGLKDPIGKTVNLWGKQRQIIGITPNFNFESLHEQVKPLFFILQPQNFLVVMAKIKAGMEKETLDKVSKFYSGFNPGFSFNYKFLDKDYQALYISEQRVSVLSRYFAGMAIIISCLGLFGLSAFSAERRGKEIGIRKVLGSSSLGIVYLLSKDFTKLVIMSVIIALPLSYLAASYWLDSFAFRIKLEPWYFVGVALTALLITWFTVGSQAIKAATANPVKSLRYE